MINSNNNESAAADAMVIANAFHDANDADTMKVLNVFSSRSTSDLLNFFFYVVPASWMRKAWPVLASTSSSSSSSSSSIAATANWREAIGSIENEHLLVWENAAVSSDDEDDDNDHDKVAKKKQQQQQQQQQQRNLMLNELQTRTAPNSSFDKRRVSLEQQRKAKLRTDLVPERDFFLLGANTWLLLKQKFGYDHEIRRKCVFVNANDNTSPVAVELHQAEVSSEGTIVKPATLIPIPPAGRFRYEEALTAKQPPPPPPPAAAAAGAAVVEKHPGNVSDDETDYGDDLFPSVDDDDRMSTDQPSLKTSSQQQQQQPILCLPPSTTSYATSNNYMDTEDDENNKEDDDDDDQVMAGTTRRKPYGSGLANLGNTCFMNSTLQCLAHTDPLRKYFLSGEYELDLNRDNPLGTGGEMAIQFAQLLGEMWGTKQQTTSGLYNGYGSSTLLSGINSVVYPRNFKYTLGRHAEQFVGYDQHDSQELATYLLDALHEDTNRVTKKPYIEKPEQGESETDKEAAAKAWALHLKREDSKVFEYFMGQVKSRVECCAESCGRVSTTFDPFMFLSVPIPGSSEKTMKVTYVPLDPYARPLVIYVTLKKTASIEDLLNKLTGQLNKFGVLGEDEAIPLEDLHPVDLWQKEIYRHYKLTEDVDGIRDSDETVVFQLRPLKEVQEIEKAKAVSIDSMSATAPLGLREKSTPKRYKLDVATLTQFNRSDWTTALTRKYLVNPLAFSMAFNPKRGSTSDRVSFYNRLANFIDLCYQDADADVVGQKRTRDESSGDSHQNLFSVDDARVAGIAERCESSHYFQNVESRLDVAVLEFVAGKMRAEILNLEQQEQEIFEDGIVVTIRLRKILPSFGLRDHNLANPFVLRIPSDMTVYGLREELARRLSRCLKTGHPSAKCSASGESTSEREVVPMEVTDANGITPATSFGPPELLIVRQVPLSYEYERRSVTYRSTSVSSIKLGVLERDGNSQEGSRPVSLASPSDEEEKLSVAEVVGNNGTIFMDWPEDLAGRCFDVNEYETVDTPCTPEDNIAGRTRNGVAATTVLDCIEKYCHREQLEESEMWYCNRCKEHVRAWKQFHMYRAPPILIVHLKRFHYSPTTHRRDKIDVFIDFPLTNLDLSDHVIHQSDKEKPIYDCYAVSNHYGGLGGGHYTAYALNDDGVWCHYDDSRVTKVDDPKEVVSKAAYVLYYRRKDISVGEDFVMNLQTPGAQTPVIVQDPLHKITEPSDDASSSNVAMVDEDEEGMDVDGDIVSRSTSPMGSSNEENFVDDFDTNGGNHLPLQ